jgi:hypothetical protein
MTGVLGLGLAIVYVVSDRAVAACIVSHFLINLFADAVFSTLLSLRCSSRAKVLAEGLVEHCVREV